VALLTLWPAIVFNVVGIGLPTAVAYFVASRQLEIRAVGRLLAAPFAIQCAVLLVAHSIILVGFLRGKPTNVAVAGLITLAMGPALLAWDYSLAILQGLKNYVPLNLFRYLPIALYACAAVFMLVSRQRSLVELTALITMAYIVSAILAALTVGRSMVNAAASTSTVPIRELVSFGLRGYLGSLYPLDRLRLDLVIVGLLLTPFSVGLYVVAFSFTNVPRFVAQGVVLVALPHISSTPDYQTRRARIMRFVLFGGVVSLVGVVILEVFVGDLVPYLFGESFRDSIVIARILLFGVLCFAIRQVLAESLKGAGFPGAGTIAEGASWLALIPALVLMVNGGAAGVAWALSFAFAFSLGLLIIVAVIWDRQQQASLANARTR
jgi:O-antigen/teichoic acid export membrane protein